MTTPSPVSPVAFDPNHDTLPAQETAEATLQRQAQEIAALRKQLLILEQSVKTKDLAIQKRDTIIRQLEVDSLTTAQGVAELSAQIVDLYSRFSLMKGEQAQMAEYVRKQQLEKALRRT